MRRLSVPGHGVVTMKDLTTRGKKFRYKIALRAYLFSLGRLVFESFFALDLCERNCDYRTRRGAA